MEWLFHDIPLLVDQLGILLAVLCIVLLLAAGVGFPLPEDIPLLVIGYLCWRAAAPLWLMIPTALAAVLAGDLMLFTLGRRWGSQVSTLWPLGRLLTPPRLQRAAAYFQSHGGKTLFLARFLPGLRAPLFFSAGMCGVPLWKMLLFDGSAALISVPALILLAYFFATQLDRVRLWTHRAEMTALAIALAILAVLVAGRYLRRRRPENP